MKYLEELVKSLELSEGVRPPSDAVIDDHVLIRFESGQFDREYELIVTVQKGQTQLIGMIDLPEGQIDIMQTLCLSPVTAAKAHADHARRMVELINKLSPIPGFGFDEIDNRPFFRHALALSPKTCSSQILQINFAALQQVIDTYLPMIEGVTLGKIDLAELIQQSEEEFAHNYKNLIELMNEIS